MINLRDKLVISICDSEDHPVTQTGRVPSCFLVIPSLSHNTVIVIWRLFGLKGVSHQCLNR